MWSLFKKRRPAPGVEAHQASPQSQRPSVGITPPTACDDIDVYDDDDDDGEPPTYSPITLALVPLPDDGRIGVVGESYYQQALRIAALNRVAGEDFSQHIAVTAALVPEPDNEWDNNAVRIDVVLGNQSLKVGYLARDLAEEYQPELLRPHMTGSLGTCPARITGGGQKYYGIYLHLVYPDELRILNGFEDPFVARRSERIAHLRNDWACTVTGEDVHQEVLRRHAATPGEESREVVASLAFCKITKGKYKGEEAIEVRIAGQRVGQLTFAMTERYRDVVRDLLSAGVEVTCDASTVNTDKGVQVELLMPPDPKRRQRRYPR
jgi:hypothetical protein